MPELVDRGYIYIAQPPLYKVKRGKSEQYLKDERAYEEYLIDGGLEDAVLQLDSGETRAGRDLKKIVEEAREIRALIDHLHTRYNRTLVEQALIAGALAADLPLDARRPIAATVASRLDLLSDETERGWTGEVSEAEGYVFMREVRGVREAHALDSGLLDSREARQLHKHAKALQEVYARPARLRRRDAETGIFAPRDLLAAVLDAGAKGVSIQRYKGLGEMNADQLWETTLDKSTRTLLQVKIGEADDADDIFSKLMGDVVEPRRDFIQENALNVANLDV
jgi:DNA gyrase subunit B